MREIEVLLNSLVNVDRPTLIAMLSTEAHTAAKLATNARRRTPLQRAKRQMLVERAARIDRILTHFRDGTTSPDMSEADIKLCVALEKRLAL